MLKPNCQQVYPYQPSGSQSAPLLSGELSLVGSAETNKNDNNGNPLMSANSTGSIGNIEMTKSSPASVPAPAEGSLYLSGSNAPSGFPQGQMLLSSIGQPQVQHSSSVDGLQNGQMLLQGNHQGRPNPQAPMQANRQQQQGGQAVGALTSSKMPKSWHNANSDAETRQIITNKIIQLLQARKTTATSGDWHIKLPQMAKKLEEALYFGAKSAAEYGDQKSLKGRLQHLAASMGSAKAQQPQQGQQPPAVGPPPQNMQRSTSDSAPVPNTTAPSMVAASRASSVPAQASTNITTANTAPPSVAPPTAPARQFISMSQINTLIGGQPLIQPQTQALAPPSQQTDAHGGSNDGQRAPQQLDPLSEESRKQQVLKQQQQRLLLLRHASKCPNDSKCHVTPHCAGMKQLWKHIMTCRDQECKTSHCVSSRYVLSHYSKCKDSGCPVCGPVREAIRRNQEKSKQIVDMTRQQGGLASNSKPGEASHAASKSKGDSKAKGEPKGKNKKNVNAAANSAGSGKLSLRLPGSALQDSKGQHNDSVIRIPPPITSAPKPVDVSLKTVDNVSCAIYSFTEQQILDHIRHLQEGLRMKASDVKDKMTPIIDHFLDHPNGYIFGRPVDPVALGIPDYFDIVKLPMDLGTIRKRLENGVYRDWEDTAQDIRLTFDNAMLYNAKTDDVHMVAKQFKRDFEIRYKTMLAKLDQEIELAKQHENACKLCGEINLKFEPPVYYCNGRRCSCQRIRRGSNYYVGGNNAYHWCAPCYNELKENQPIKMADMTLYKKDLVKKKHTEEFDESWVACDRCGSWVHMVCALFNSRRNLSEKMPFICPFCILKERQAITDKSPPIMPEKKTQAADLPMCKLSAFLERRVLERLEIAYRERATKLAVSYEEVEKCSSIAIRQVSSVDKMHRTREGMLARYGCKDYPAEFPCRSKCVVLFQNIDGQDVMLFGMYVYEYDHKCPQPNQRRVYISYLDSVHYFRPRQYRTVVYHEILVAYLEYVKLRGFHTAHIWACPPLKGDDYILYCHPQDQKTPKDDRLRLWYVQMLDICKQRGIVLETSDIYKEYLENPVNDATILPYFEGDYWVGEAENIIKGLGGKKALGLEDDDEGDEVEDAIDVKSKSKNKAKSKKRERASTRSAASTGPARRDVVMTKLAAIIEPMKEAFFVAKLHSDEFAKACAELREKEIIEENGGAEAPKKRMKSNASSLDVANMVSLKANPDIAAIATKIKTEQGTEASNKLGPDLTNVIGEPAVVDPIDTSAEAPTMDVVEEEPVAAAPVSDVMSVDGGVAESKEGKDESEPPAAAVPAEKVGEMPCTKCEEASNVGEDGVEVKKLLANGKFERVDEVDEDTIEGVQGSAVGSAADLGIKSESVGDVVIIDTADVDDTQEFEHFETRQAFLNLCQGNHYQFDQLRRAKLASLMVLYHLHNPDTPKFVAQCATCNDHINAGYRYHCESCDVDFCQRCYSYNGSKIHPPHPLRPVAVGGSQQTSHLTAEQLRERQRNIQIHLAVLQHSALCSVSDCKTKNCSKMKVDCSVFFAILDF